MAHAQNKKLGLLERTIQEFEKKGYNSLEEISEYLQKEYNLTVTNYDLRISLESI
jgi:hypothetical protein